MNKIIILWVTIIFIAACTNNKVNSKLLTYRADATSYCKAHSLEHWQATGKLEKLNTVNPTEKQKMLLAEIKNSVKSPEMKNIIFNEGKDIGIQGFYSFLQNRIPELTEEPFDCPDIKFFYEGKS